MNILTNRIAFLSFLLATILFPTDIFAQKTFDAHQIALNYLKQNAKNWQLSEADIADVAVQYSYETAHNGVKHVYLIQRYAGIEVYNALVNINILPSGEVFYAGNRFISNLKVNGTKPLLTPSKALSLAAQEVGLSFSEKNTPLSINDKKEYIFEENSVSHQKMTVKLLFFPINETGEARLVWDLNIDAVNSSDHWTMRIDALTGLVLDKKSFTTHCSFEDDFLKNQDTDCTENTPLSIKSTFVPSAIDVLNIAGKGTYRVFQLPTESPLYGNSTLVVDPADSLASPYGWHDTTGTVGAEFTITRGNNAHAFLDWRNRNISFGDEPDGGADLIFDYPYSTYASSDSMKSAAAVNLFYMNNMMHDITYRYGFDEVAGNFQQKNYTGLGKGKDYVVAQAQDGGRLPDPSLNNANFSAPVDGASGAMQMYLWGRRNLRNLTVTAPSSFVGTYATGIAGFGFGSEVQLPLAPLAGQIVLFNDGTTKPTEACQPSRINLSGKIAMIDRGLILSNTCSYGRKILNAQDSGAIAVILCNFLPTTPNAFNDSLTDITSQVRIPAVTMSSTDCNRLRLAIGSNNLQAFLAKNPADTVGADFVDGDFENGIIAHEYGHGISIRLTGGPANSSCLNLGEQMGEGWSDFFAMIMTAKPGDRGNMARGMGNFALRQNTDARGIRRYPYSTDMNINPHTYNNIYLSQVSPHPIGEIWATTIWDLYWAMTDKYGWDANIKNRNSGNGKAIQLVIDGMKLQPCNPGFIDGRNAIIAADRANNNGENQCLIWDVFARRGVGFNANQGRGSSATDNVEGFNTMPTCLKMLKLTKTMTPNISAGDNFDVRLKLINHKDNTVAGLNLTDILPDGASFVSVISPSNSSATFTAPNILQFTLTDSLRSGDSLEIVYRLKSSGTKKSTAQLFEDFEKTTTLFDSSFVSGTRTWATVVDFTRPSGKRTIRSANGIGSSDQLLSLRSPFAVRGTQPVVRFLHRFNTEGGNDSGIFEVYVEGDTGWIDLSSRMFRNAATGPTYLTYPFKTQAFWGAQDTFATTYVDLKDFIGQNIQIRFHFKSNATTNSNGWAVDDILFLDMVNYQSPARLVSAQRDTVVADVSGRGTIVEPDIMNATRETVDQIGVHIYPNPTRDVLNVSILTVVETAKISLMSIEGKVLFQEKMVGGQNLIPLSISAFPTGLYFLRIETEKGNIVKKFVKN